MEANNSANQKRKMYFHKDPYFYTPKAKITTIFIALDGDMQARVMKTPSSLTLMR